MSRFLIKNGCVLSMDPEVGNHRDADILIDGPLIAEIGPGIRARDAEVIDAGAAIVMPGFVDAHRCAAGSLFRGAGDTETDSHPADRLAADDVYAGTLVGLLGAVEAGITTVVDWSQTRTAEQTEAAVRAHADSGLRTILVDSADAVAPDVSGDRQPVVQDDTGQTSLMHLGAGMTIPADSDERVGSRARELGRRLFVRLSDGSAGHRMLGPGVTVILGGTPADADLDAIASSGAAVVLTPASDMAAGVQPVSVQKLIDRGIRPGLGIGTERLTPGDMFTQLRTVISLQHAAHFDRKLAGKAGLPRLLNTREVIRYGTIDGAATIGLGSVIGSLTPGKQADIVVLATDRPNIFPVNDPIGAVVWGMDTSNVDWVFVAGRPVLRHGEIGADLDRARHLAETAVRRVARPGDPAERPAAETPARQAPGPAVGSGTGGAA